MQQYYYLSNLTTVVLSIGLAVFILIQGRKNTNILFALYSLCVAVWAGAKFISWVSISNDLALFFMQLSVATAVFIPIIYFHFSIVFTGQKNKMFWIYALSSVLFLLSFSPYMIRGLGIRDGIRTIIAGPLYIIFWVFFGVFIVFGLLNFRFALKKSDPRKRNQIKYLILASIIGFGGGMLVFGSNLFPLLEPFGYGFIPLYSVIAAYAIVKHRLLDISVVIRRGIAYSILSLLITGMYFLTFSVFRDIIGRIIGTNSFLVNLPLILIFVVLFQPLQNKVQEVVDQIFYKEKIDREKEIIFFSDQVMKILELRELLRFIVSRVKQVLKIKNASIYVKDRKSNLFFDQDLNILEDDFLHKLSMNFEVIFISDTELVFPIYLKKELLGVLHIKEKDSGDSFSYYEVDLIKTFLNQAAAALKNAFLLDEIIEHKRQLYQASNLASLGTLSAGMAHEIKNPLAVIKGLTQILPQNISDQEFLDKFVKIVPGQIDRINQTIEALLKVGKKPIVHKMDTDLNLLLNDVVDFVKIPFKKKNVEVVLDFSEIKLIKADYNLLYQAFFNLLQNAAQAMSNGGIITIKTEFQARGSVMDTGEGIAADKIDRIFSPFVTIKKDGIGLGLFMVKKILEEHDAHVNVHSKVGEGTCFCVDFENN